MTGPIQAPVVTLLCVGLLVAIDARDLRFGWFGRTDRLLLTAWFAGAMILATTRLVGARPP